jgi:hypothetical protein
MAIVTFGLRYTRDFGAWKTVQCAFICMNFLLMVFTIIGAKSTNYSPVELLSRAWKRASVNIQSAIVAGSAMQIGRALFLLGVGLKPMKQEKAF